MTSRTQQILNTLSVVLTTAGGCILWRYGFPQPSHEEGIGIALEDANVLPDGRTVSEHDRDVRAQKTRYARISRIALGLVLLGVVLQLIATWLPED